MENTAPTASTEEVNPVADPPTVTNNPATDVDAPIPRPLNGRRSPIQRPNIKRLDSGWRQLLLYGVSNTSVKLLSLKRPCI